MAPKANSMAPPSCTKIYERAAMNPDNRLTIRLDQYLSLIHIWVVHIGKAQWKDYENLKPTNLGFAFESS